MKEFRVLVCGGRDYGTKVVDGKMIVDKEQVDKLYKVLDNALQAATQSGKRFALIHGNARGADKLSDEWAKSRKISDISRYPADWDTHGKSAGPIRNRYMLTDSEPHVIVAFKGGAGTADMIRIGRKANVPVYEVKE